MSHDIPSNSPEKKEETPTTLRETLWLRGEFVATPEDIELFNELVGRDSSPEDLQLEKIGLIDHDIAYDLMEATGPLYEQLDTLNTIMWRKQAVYEAAIKEKKEKNNT